MYFLLPLALVALCWVALIRPQQQRVRRQQTMLRAVVPGDEVVLAGGLVGTVREVGEVRARVEVAPGVVVTVLVPAIQSLAGDAVPNGAGSSAADRRGPAPAASGAAGHDDPGPATASASAPEADRDEEES
jgi:preprotein translocase subunit YajC